MINLFRNLKRNVEGSSLVNHERRAPAATRTQIGGAAATGWKQGLAASLAELTKRFASILTTPFTVESMNYICGGDSIYISRTSIYSIVGSNP